MYLVVVTKVGVEGSRTSLSNVRCQRVSWRALGSNIILSTRSVLPTSFYKSSSHALPIDQGFLILLYNDQEWGLEHSSQVLASKRPSTIVCPSSNVDTSHGELTSLTTDIFDGPLLPSAC